MCVCLVCVCVHALCVHGIATRASAYMMAYRGAIAAAVVLFALMALAPARAVAAQPAATEESSHVASAGGAPAVPEGAPLAAMPMFAVGKTMVHSVRPLN